MAVRVSDRPAGSTGMLMHTEVLNVKVGIKKAIILLLYQSNIKFLRL